MRFKADLKTGLGTTGAIDRLPKQQIYGPKPRKTHQIQRSIRRQIGALFGGIFDFKVEKRKIGGKFVINRALDTNMLGGNPGVGPIFHEFHEKRGGRGGRGMKSRKAMKTTNTRTPKHDTRLLLTPVATGPT